jgi:hypothetical protein
VIELAKYERKFREVDDLVLHLKGLVLVRALLKERGASEAELHEHSAEIDRVRLRLAALVQKGGDKRTVATAA